MTTSLTWDKDPYLENLRESDFETYSEYLSSLVSDINSARVLISYRFTPEHLLEAVAEQHDVLRYGVLQHPNCPRKIVEWAVQEGTEESISALVSSPVSISGDALADIWAKSELVKKVALASRADCPADVLMDTWNSDFSEDSLFENNREIALKNIASNPNIPKKLIVEFMKYPLDTIFDGSLTLGQLLLQNPAVADETKALLVLRGAEKRVHVTEEDIQRLMYWWPSTHAYTNRSIDVKVREIFSGKGHPESILDTRENVTSVPYDAKVALQYWAIEEKKRIYKCLWPDLAENPKVNFFFSASSWNGDYAYVGVAGGLDLSDDLFQNKVRGTENWIISSNRLTYEDVVEEIADRGFVDILESEPTEEIIISAAISEMSNDGLFAITEKGQKYILDAGNDWFEDDMTYSAEVKPDPAQKVWSQLDEKRQQVIADVITSTLQDRSDKNFEFAEYLGALIVLNPRTPDGIRKQLEGSKSELIKQAFNV